MMPNGSQANNSWGTQQWFAAPFGQEQQMQGLPNVNFQMIAAQQIPNVYGAGQFPVWNAALQQWVHQWPTTLPPSWNGGMFHNTQPPPPLPPSQPSTDIQHLPPLPKGSYVAHNPVVLSEEEKNFDNQFREWEEKFQAWKEENKNHPDKTAMAVYEAQWQTWREHLIQNREKLRKQREDAAKIPPIAIVNSTGSAPELIRPSGSGVSTFYDSKNCPPNLFQPLPQTFQLTGTPLINIPQHNAYSNINQASLNSSTNFTASSSQINNHHYEEGNIQHSGSFTFNQSSGNQVKRPDEKSHPPHVDSHLRHANHSNNLKTQLLPDPVFCSARNDPNSHITNSSWRSDVPPSGYLISDQSEIDQRHYPNSTPNHRESSIPQSNQLRVRGPEDATHGSPFNNSDNRDPSSFLAEPPSETAADVFRRRAIRGKFARQQVAPYKTPETCLDRRLLSNGSAFNAITRSQFDQRVVGKIESPLSSSSSHHRQETDGGLLNPSPLPPLTSLPNVIEPVVFEYNHLPGRNGRFAVANIEPLSIDYAHGKKSSNMESLESRRKIEVEILPHGVEPLPISKTLFDNIPIEKSPVKGAPLFPSAAAIKEEDPLPITKPPLMPDPLFESPVKDVPKMSHAAVEMEMVMVEDLLLPPGRYGRPSKIVVILRGLPGSGKSHLARLIKEKEVLMGGSAPRILSIDDYYLMDDGSSPVGWQEDQEETYRQSLLKSLKRNLDDGHFSFIIVDALCIKVTDVLDVYNTARSRAFAVFLVDLPDNSRVSTTRKCTEKDIEKMKSDWEHAPNEVPRLEIRWLLQETVEQPIPTPEDAITSTTVLLDEDSRGSSGGTPTVSKWEMMEQTGEKLDRLDGIVKRKLDKPASMQDWLQSDLPDDYNQRKCIEGKKRVRWADVEEQIQQKKIRDMGFVVGQTNWSKMTDQTCGESALTKTKYI